MEHDDWGPWIEHDGASPQIPNGSVIEVTTIMPGIAVAAGTTVGFDFPGFYWRWKRVRVGWFWTERRRVCDDPTYAPIAHYRLRRYRAASELIASAQRHSATVQAACGVEATQPAQKASGAVGPAAGALRGNADFGGEER